ncbi:uncharacterized protein LOC143318471 [Chaetodon auriga]|uniref:uncharacterized protein LOC143318471 n=1 Tax=Chaetodon auriga TaxID=39042 RepID=UPI004032A434
MSLAEEPSLEHDQKEPELCLQEDNKTNDSDPDDQKVKNTRKKDLMSRQRDKSPLSLLKEDFSQFKEEVFKVFKDKETKMEHEDRPSTQAENKLVSTTLGLLKEDFSQFKEDVTSVFSVSLSKDKETKSTEKTMNRLSFLKEDFSQFKDDLSNVFRIGLSKDRDTAKEDLSNTFKMKVSKAERTDDPFKSLFRRDQKTSQKAENSQGVKQTCLETSEEQKDDGFRGNLPEQEEDSEVDITERLSETQQSEEMTPSRTAEQRCESEEGSDDSSVVSAEDRTIHEEDEDQPPETRPWESLSSGISLFTLRHSNKEVLRDQRGGDSWSVKNFACYLTFDPNTANSELHLTDCNRKVTRVWLEHQPPDHPDRFERCPQVLCREGLLDSVYWEVMWNGGADIGVTYNSVSRGGDPASCLLGHNKWSWSLECSEGSYTPCHDNKRFRSCSPRPFTHRVGVYLDWSAGSLSFYCVSQDSMVLLHTFTSTFTEPLYPGFWVWAYDGSVSLCHVELDWERLLQ